MLKKLEKEERKNNRQMKNNNLKLTIFTPTYNRAYILDKLYNSLKEQTDKNFIWLIVDDGSTDDTTELVEKWQKENKIKIEYYKKLNGGKHTAIDFANEVCKTKYIACVDSDDYLDKTGVETVNSHLSLVGDNIGIVYVRAMKNKYAGGDELDGKSIYFYDLDKTFGVIPETFLVFKTDFIKQFKFPTFENEKFVTEGVLYNKFMHDHKILFKKERMYISEYIADGYTNQGINLFFKNPQGELYFLKQESYYSKNLKRKLAYAAQYYAWKKVLKLDDIMPADYKIKFPFNILGKMLAWKFTKSYKEKYKKFLDENGTK